MEKKKNSWWWMNPLRWLDAAVDGLLWLFGPILRFFGMMPPPRTDGFENLQKADIDDAARDATEAEKAIDMILADRSPAEIVKAYAAADPATRETMDLSVLDPDSQSWLLTLTDDELTLLAMSTVGGCARSLEARAMKPIFVKRKAEIEAAEILRVPTAEDEEEQKRAFVAARFRELFHAPGMPNANPRHVPVSTLH